MAINCQKFSSVAVNGKHANSRFKTFLIVSEQLTVIMCINGFSYFTLAKREVT